MNIYIIIKVGFFSYMDQLGFQKDGVRGPGAGGRAGGLGGEKVG